MHRRSLTLGKRAAVLCAVVFACVVAPVYADDPLLSGYSGPGGGEQVVIGSSVLPAKNGNGSIRKSSAPAGASAQSSPSSSAGDNSSSGGADGESSPEPQNNAAAADPAPASAAKPTYPNTISSASSLPLSRGDMIVAAVVALLALLVGLGARRLRSAG